MPTYDYKVRDFGTHCSVCNTLWVHGMCRCDNTERIGCDCEKCETPAPEPVIKRINDVHIKAFEMFDDKWVIEVTAYKKTFWGKVGHKKGSKVLRVYGKEYSWKNMDTMDHVTSSTMDRMLSKIHKVLLADKV